MIVASKRIFRQACGYAGNRSCAGRGVQFNWASRTLWAEAPVPVLYCVRLPPPQGGAA